MTEYFTNEIIFHLIIFQLVILVILTSNIWITRRARHHTTPQEFPMVSVLIPARNEVENIAKCVRSLLEQKYPSFEILVLDDQSTDGTREILKEISKKQPKLHLLDGLPPAKNIVGKNWACQQLADHARGELLLFTDADTRHRPNMLHDIVTASIGEQADLLTGYPRQLVHSWGERLLVPSFSWVLCSFIPLGLGYRLTMPAMASAVGQLMLFRREAYDLIGGHTSVGDSIVDDLSLARRIKSSRLRWRVLHVADLVSCRMYQSSQDAINGFTKNLFAVFDYRLLPFLFAFFWLLFMFWEPLIVAFIMLMNRAKIAQPVSLALCIALSLLLWIFHYKNMGISIGLAFLYPLTILANAVVATKSCIQSIKGELEWKGRKIAKIHWKWL